VGLFAGLVDLSVGPGDERLEVTPRLSFRGKSREFGEVGRDALVKVMQPAHLLQIEPLKVVALTSVQRPFKLLPVRPFLGDELLDVYDHDGCALHRLGEGVEVRMMAEVLQDGRMMDGRVAAGAADGGEMTDDRVIFYSIVVRLIVRWSRLIH